MSSSALIAEVLIFLFLTNKSSQITQTILCETNKEPLGDQVNRLIQFDLFNLLI